MDPSIMKPIELSSECALEAINQIDEIVAGGGRPSVVITNVDGLSPEFIQHLMCRDDLDATLSEHARSQLVCDGAADASTAFERLLYAVATLMLLGLVGAGILLRR